MVAASGWAGCTTQPLDARSRFVEDGVSIEAHAEWAGEKIVVDNAGVTSSGGISVTTGERSRVLAIARMLAVAGTLDKPSADEAIIAAKATFFVTTSYALQSFSDPRITSVRCGEARSRAGDTAGCDALDVALPAGTLEQPLLLSARSGNGRVAISLGAEVRELDVHASHGPIEVTVPATRGAILSIVADTGDDVVLRLPPDFAADAITLETGGAVDTAAFPDVRSGKGRGAAGLGAKSITVRSAAPGSTGGRVVLLAQ